MIHRAHRDFWAPYRELPAPTRELADRCFRMLKADPRHPSLRLKRAGNFWSVRVGVNYRAVAVGAPDGLTWVWIGPHDRYEGYIE